jgi:hypothetical protein
MEGASSTYDDMVTSCKHKGNGCHQARLQSRQLVLSFILNSKFQKFRDPYSKREEAQNPHLVLIERINELLDNASFGNFIERLEM